MSTPDIEMESGTCHSLGEMELILKSTGDGSVDLRGRPAIRDKTGGWRTTYFIFGLSLVEEAMFIGVTLNLITYLILTMHIHTAKAANIITNLIGVNFFITILWGFMSDTFVRRFFLLVVSQVITIVGMVLLTLVVSIKTLKPPFCASTLTSTCEPVGERYMGPFLFALYLVSFGSGGIKSNNATLGADQFDHTNPKEQKQRELFFLWYTFWTQLGIVFAVTFVVYIQDSSGRIVGYGLNLGLMVGGLIVFLSGTPFFRHKIPGGSPIVGLMQVLIAATRKWKVPYPQDADDLYELVDDEKTNVHDSTILLHEKLPHSNKLRCFDKAAIVTNEDNVTIDSTKKPNTSQRWHLCTVTQVEGLKRIIQMLPIWLVTVMQFLIYAQLGTFNVMQALTMDRHLGKHFQIPPASMSVFMLGTVVITVPLYTKFVIPCARKVTGSGKGLSMLRRIGVGTFCAMAAMITAALVENKRVKEIREKGLTRADPGTYQLDLHVKWLIPQNVFMGLTDLFSTIAMMEFYFGQVPDTMRGTGSALFGTANGVGYFLSSALVNFVNEHTKHQKGGSWLTARLNDGGLSDFFWLLASLMAATTIWHIFFSCFYEYKVVLPGRNPTYHVQSSPQDAEMSPCKVSPTPRNSTLESNHTIYEP